MGKIKSRIPQIPILGITGVNGTGKTMLAVELCIDYMMQGWDVYSTVPIKKDVYQRRGFKMVYSHTVESKPLRSVTQFLDLENAVVLLDEISAIFSSGAHGLPSEVITKLKSLRHYNVAVIWTSPNWIDCDVKLRRVTQALAVCRGIVRKRDGSLYPPARLTAIGVLDTSSVGTDQEPERVLARRFWLLQRSFAKGAYDTHADVPQVGRVLRQGLCPDCGGTRKNIACSAELHASLGIAPALTVDELAERHRLLNVDAEEESDQSDQDETDG